MDESKEILMRKTMSPLCLMLAFLPSCAIIGTSNGSEALSGSQEDSSSLSSSPEAKTSEDASESSEEAPYEVDLTGWNKAFDGLDNFTLTCTYEGNSQTLKVAGEVFELLTVGDVPISICSKEDGQWYSYSYESSSKAWSKVATSSDLDKQLSLYRQEVFFGGEEYYKSFLYDEESRAYCCESLEKTVTEVFGYDWVFTDSDVKVSFLEGSLTFISFLGPVGQGYEDLQMAYAVSDIGSTIVDLPKVP